jgi:hypothetical protein
VVSAASRGAVVKIQSIFPAMPLAHRDVSEMRRELQAHATSLVSAWHQRSAADKSAEALSVALAIDRFCGLDVLRDLRCIAAKTADGRQWHPPLQYTGVADLTSYLRGQRKGLGLASSLASMRYLQVHLTRQPPVDTWPMLEIALAEAAVSLGLPVRHQGWSTRAPQPGVERQTKPDGQTDGRR